MPYENQSEEKISNLYKAFCTWKGSEPNSCYFFSLDVSLIAPVIDKDAFY